MLRGIRRLFGFLAVMWLLLTGFVFLTSNGPDRAGSAEIIIGAAIAIYGAGWAITYLAGGFKKPRGRIIDL